MMRKRSRSARSSRRPAFTLFEAVLAVMVTAICMSVLFNVTQALAVSKKRMRSENALAFSYIQLEKYMHKDAKRVYLKSCSNSEAVIGKIHKDGTEDSFTMRKTKTTGRLYVVSYMELLPALNVLFQRKGNNLRIMVTEPDCRTSNLYFALDPPPEEKEQHESKKGPVDEKKETKQNEG